VRVRPIWKLLLATDLTAVHEPTETKTEACQESSFASVPEEIVVFPIDGFDWRAAAFPGLA
jgi:hypothetical protein